MRWHIKCLSQSLIQHNCKVNISSYFSTGNFSHFSWMFSFLIAVYISKRECLEWNILHSVKFCGCFKWLLDQNLNNNNNKYFVFFVCFIFPLFEMMKILRELKINIKSIVSIEKEDTPLRSLYYTDPSPISSYGNLKSQRKHFLSVGNIIASQEKAMGLFVLSNM